MQVLRSLNLPKVLYLHLLDSVHHVRRMPRLQLRMSVVGLLGSAGSCRISGTSLPTPSITSLLSDLPMVQGHPNLLQAPRTRQLGLPSLQGLSRFMYLSIAIALPMLHQSQRKIGLFLPRLG